MVTAASPSGSRRGLLAGFAAFALYGAVSLALWSRLLAHGFGSALPAGSADPAQEVWFLAWVPHALGSATDPFFTHLLFAPHGVNLLANTSIELIGLLLSPVTVLAGPIATLDLAVVLAPALSALGAFVLCRRYTRWLPAAVCGGLCYGFGPFCSGDLRFAHLDLTWLVLPPLIFCCLDALFVHRSVHRIRTGMALGVLVVAQFFVSTEMLAITAIVAIAALLIAGLTNPRAVIASVHRSGVALAVALIISIAALAYPVFLVVAGPRHVSGAVWTHVSNISTSLQATVAPHAELARVAFVSGSNGSFLGIPLLCVLLLGAAALWRSSALRTALLVAAFAYLASLGAQLYVSQAPAGVTLPESLLGHVPLLDSIAPYRFSSMVDLFCGLALAIVVDHVRGRAQSGAPTAVRSWLAVAVGAFALVPFGFVTHWPYSVTTLRHPRFVTALDHKGAPPVVVFFPDTATWAATEMVWQTQREFSFAMPNGYAIVPDPKGGATESPPTRAIWQVFASASFGRLSESPTPSTVAALRADLRALHAKSVVVVGGVRGASALVHTMVATAGQPRSVRHGAAQWVLTVPAP